MHSATLPSSTFSNSLAQAAMRSAHLTETVKGILLSASYFVVAQMGVMTMYDGVLYIVAAAFCLPHWRPYLLLLALSLQDAKGQVVPFDYIAVAAISAMLFASAALRANSLPISEGLKEFRALITLGIVLVLYGILNSAIQNTTMAHQQAPHRPYFIVGALMATMMCTAYLAHREIYFDAYALTRLRSVVVCILIHIFFVAIMQLFYGPTFGASPQGMAEMIQQDQTINPGARGFARLTGPFLSPNALASVPALFMLMLLRTRRSAQISMVFIAAFFTAGMIASTLGAARTMFIFYLVASGAMTWTRSPSKTLIATVLCTPLILLTEIPWDEVLVLMRLSNLQSLGVRGRLWQVALDNLGLTEWMFGFGITHFPVMYKSSLGYFASDPHNWILSVTGMFGIAGLFFYLYVGYRILLRAFAKNTTERAIAVALAIFLVGRELGNTQYLLNNHPMCCLYWMSVGFVFVKPGELMDSLAGAEASS